MAIVSDCIDDDHNGYIDDISGWDFFGEDNDPFDNVRFQHGTGTSKRAAAEGENGLEGIGWPPVPPCWRSGSGTASSWMSTTSRQGSSTRWTPGPGWPWPPLVPTITRTSLRKPWRILIAKALCWQPRPLMRTASTIMTPA